MQQFGNVRAKGLLAGLYELPNIEGELSADEALEYQQENWTAAAENKRTGSGKTYFQPCGMAYDQGLPFEQMSWKNLAQRKCCSSIRRKYKESIQFPAAFEYYTDFVDIKLGQEKYEE